jgi:hypothetical protein
MLKQVFMASVPSVLKFSGGAKLWIKKVDICVGGSSESEGLPGHNGPGVAAADVDGDGKCEVVGRIQRKEFTVQTPPEAGICKECDLRLLCNAEGIVSREVS